MDIQGILERASRCSQTAEAIVCTGKDLAKLSSNQLGTIPLWALEIELQLVAGADVAYEYLDRLCQSIPTS
jgi:hypothetical protein